MKEPTREDVAAAIEHRCNIAGQCGHHAAGRPAADACGPAPGAYVDRRHAEVLARIDELRVFETFHPPAPDLTIVESLCATCGEHVAHFRHRDALVNLAAWALRGIALHDGEKP